MLHLHSSIFFTFTAGNLFLIHQSLRLYAGLPGVTADTERHTVIRETALTSRCDHRAEKIGQSYESTPKHMNLIDIRIWGRCSCGDFNPSSSNTHTHTWGLNQFVLPLERQNRDDNRPQSYFFTHNQMAREELEPTSTKSWSTEQRVLRELHL